MENTETPEGQNLEELAARGRKLRDDSFRALAQALSMLTGCLALTLVITQTEEQEDGQQQGVTQHFSICNYGNEIMVEHQGAAAEMLYEEQQALIGKLQEAREKARQEAAEGMPVPGEDDAPAS